jgi:glycosyltransferase involved in cell wall biosynthesis
MRLAFIATRADDLGGAQVHVRDLCAGLAAQGHKVTVLAGGQGVFSEELRRVKVDFRSVAHLAVPIHPLRDARAFGAVVQALRELRPDLVLAHTAKAGFLGRAAAALLGIPAVFTPHGWAISDRISRRQGRVFRVLEKAAARTTARIVNVCDFEMRLALEHGIAPREKMAVVYNGIPDIPAHLLARPAAQPARLVMVARMAPPKDHATVLRALAGLAEMNWTLDLIGDGPLERAIRAMANELGIAGRVRFRGFQSGIAAHLAGAQALVLSSRFEAFPYAVLEAMRAGLPVVASHVGGIPEAVEDGVTGLLAPAGNAAALRDCLARMIADPARRSRYGAAARERFLERFTLDRMIRDTVRVYRGAIGDAGARRRVGGGLRGDRRRTAPSLDPSVTLVTTDPSRRV